MFICRPQFGTVFDLTASEFVDSIDKEQPTVFVIVHIYEKVHAALHSVWPVKAYPVSKIVQQPKQPKICHFCDFLIILRLDQLQSRLVEIE